MDLYHTVIGFVQENEAAIIFILAALSFFLFISNLYLLAKVGKLGKARRMAAAPAGAPTSDSDDRVAQLVQAQLETDRRLNGAFQRVGVVRFDAFPDVGGEQSFALAILDGNLNGIVMSNLYSRSDSRVYAKEITEGRSQHALSNEEKEALRRAGETDR